jgi:hypothetical protein
MMELLWLLLLREEARMLELSGHSWSSTREHHISWLLLRSSHLTSMSMTPMTSMASMITMSSMATELIGYRSLISAKVVLRSLIALVKVRSLVMVVKMALMMLLLLRVLLLMMMLLLNLVMLIAMLLLLLLLMLVGIELISSKIITYPLEGSLRSFQRNITSDATSHACRRHHGAIYWFPVDEVISNVFPHVWSFAAVVVPVMDEVAIVASGAALWGVEKDTRHSFVVVRLVRNFFRSISWASRVLQILHLVYVLLILHLLLEEWVFLDLFQHVSLGLFV